MYVFYFSLKMSTSWSGDIVNAYGQVQGNNYLSSVSAYTATSNNTVSLLNISNKIQVVLGTISGNFYFELPQISNTNNNSWPQGLEFLIINDTASNAVPVTVFDWSVTGPGYGNLLATIPQYNAARFTLIDQQSTNGKWTCEKLGTTGDGTTVRSITIQGVPTNLTPPSLPDQPYYIPAPTTSSPMVIQMTANSPARIFVDNGLDASSSGTNGQIILPPAATIPLGTTYEVGVNLGTTTVGINLYSGSTNVFGFNDTNTYPNSRVYCTLVNQSGTKYWVYSRIWGQAGSGGAGDSSGTGYFAAS